MQDVHKRERSTVLIVEDSRSISSELDRLIKRDLGFDTCVCPTKAAALDFLDKNSEDIFLAILDLNLPDSPDGGIVDYFCDRDIPSIVFTGNMDSFVRDEMLSKKIIDYIIKDTQAVPNIIDYIKQLRQNQDIRVLIIEDSFSFRSSLQDVLLRQMYDVTGVETAEDGLKLLGEEEFTLAIVDYELPGMDGVDFTRKARANHSRDDLAIVGISTSKTPLLSVRYIKAGANDFLPKPFLMEELLSRVSRSVENVVTLAKYKKASAIKNRFLGMASHDLRSPINGIKGFSELLLDGVYGDITDDQREALEHIRTTNNHMLSLVVDLLDIAVIESGELQLHKAPEDLAALIDLRLRIHGVNAKKKNISMESLCDDLGKFEFDASRMGQVMDNLLSNALKFTQDGGSVKVLLRKKKHMAEVCVQDSGQGVPPGEEELLFQSFKKTSVRPTAGEQSTGLGLPIVKTIIEEHGGSVWVESEYGKGAAFCFVIPLESPA